jgi:hypothetical protein
MFLSFGIIGIPYFIQMQERTQIIDVPVRTAGDSRMMSNSGVKASGAEGTAHINIVTGLDSKPAEFSHFNPLIGRRFKDQGIGTG